MKRGYGEGEIRVGGYLDVREDLYSLGFMCQMKEQYVDEVMEDGFDRDAAKKVEFVRSGARSTAVTPKRQMVIQFEDEKIQKSLEYELAKKIELRRQRRLNINLHIGLTFISQMSLTTLIFGEIFYTNIDSLSTPRESLPLLMARFICTSILHMALQDELTSGMNMMKYAVNH